MHRLPLLSGIAACAALQLVPVARAQSATDPAQAPATHPATATACAFLALERIPAGTALRFVEDARTPRPGFASAPAGTRTFEWTALAEIAAGELVPLNGVDTPRWTWSGASARVVAYSLVLGAAEGYVVGADAGEPAARASAAASSAVPPGSAGNGGGVSRRGAADPDADVAPFIFVPSSTTVGGGPLGRPGIVPVARCGAVRAQCGSGTSVNGCTPLLTGSGLPSATATSGFTLTVIAMDGARPAGMFYGLRQQPAQIGTGSSYFCDPSVHQRIRGAWALSSGTPGSCDGSISVDLNAELASHPSWHGAPFAFGQVLYVQAYNRDPGNPSNSINVSEGLAVTLCF